MKEWFHNLVYFLLSCIAVKLVDDNLPDLHWKKILKRAFSLGAYLLLGLFLIRLVFTNPKRAQQALLYGSVLAVYNGKLRLLCLPPPAAKKEKPRS